MMMTSRFAWLRSANFAPDDGGASGGGDAGAAAGADAAAAAAAAGGEAKPGADGKAAADGAPAVKKDALAANDALANAGKSDDKPGAADGDAKDGEGDNKDADADKAAKDAADADEAKKWEAEPAEIYKTLQYPEGFETQQELISPVLDMFKAEKVSPELAQKIVNKHLETVQASEKVWMDEVNTQWDTFTTDAEFYKDGKLTQQAEQAYGAVRNLSPETQSLFAFLNKNGGIFHPGFKELVKLVSAGVSEGKISGGKNPTNEQKGSKGFYSKTNFTK